ncbi:MAG: ABC transporter permease [Halanaerobiales bacterium]|nr:ABC transporter permease [Halanaerobiales bacterium]
MSVDNNRLISRRFITILSVNKLAIIGAIIVVLVIASALFTVVDQHFFKEKLITAVLYNPYQMDIFAKLQPPSLGHPFGTDQLGRDVLARIIYGAKISVQVGLMAVVLSGLIGTILGMLAGYFGGIFDDIMMRVVDILLAFPGIILAIAVAGFLEPSLINVIIALSVKSWVSYARLMRSKVMIIKGSEYIKAVHILGGSNYRILFKHLLPNAITPIIVQATMDLGAMMIAEAGLSFLGLGPQPPLPSWGNMLSLGRTYMINAWWLAVFPGIAIFLTVIGFNLLGDTLRDAYDPKLSN